MALAQAFTPVASVAAVTAIHGGPILQLTGSACLLALSVLNQLVLVVGMGAGASTPAATMAASGIAAVAAGMVLLQRCVLCCKICQLGQNIFKILSIND